ncbi:MFS transporter [Horticoccus sp. 23ND18S-11]|uniref:MFS transporter n=1 Tax=Horticoccus sp. 23ND18S-11 TaxID=3391832 RepID=UPI0039C9692D
MTPSPAPAPEPTAPSGLRWVMIGFAFFATLINYLDRQVLSVVVTSPDFKAAVPLTEETYGYVTSAFMLAYAVMNGLSGPFIDRVGTRVGYAACMLWWSVAGILHVFARGAFSLGLFRFLLGAGEAGNWPAAAKLVGEWFPPKERALASGIFNSGAAIGAVISTPVIAWLVLQWGWQPAFVIMGGLGLVWIAGWWWTYSVPKAGAGEVAPAPVPVRDLVRTRFVIMFTISKVFMDPVWYFFVFWFPKYLSEVHHFSLKEIGWKGWIPYFTAAIGNLAGGVLTAQLIRRGVAVPAARKISTVAFAALMLCTIPAILTDRAWLAIALISLTTFGYTGYTANTLAFPADVFPKNAVASVWGLASMGSGFGGMLFMALSGWLIARHGYTPVFIGYGLMPVIAALLILFGIGALRRDPRFAVNDRRGPAA